MAEEPKRRGRPRKYDEGASKDNEGAPKLNIRFDPALYAYVIAKPEGPRAYLERVVRQEMETSVVGPQE